MGIMGAAIATGISQTVSWLIVAIHFIMRRGDLKICKYKPQMAMFGQIIFFGLPEMIAQFETPVTTICLNNVIVANLGDTQIEFALCQTENSVWHQLCVVKSTLYIGGIRETLIPLFLA